MRTNIDIDEKIMSEAIKLTNIKTKKGVVEFALRELISQKKRQKLLKFKGKLKWEGNLNKMRQV